MSANPVTETISYRENIFEKLPNLEALDGYSKDGDEWSFEDMTELRRDDDDASEGQTDYDEEEEGEEEKSEDFKEPKIDSSNIEESKDEVTGKEELQ